MKSIILGILLLALPSLTYAETTFSDVQRWIELLPELFTEKSETGSIYLQNYLQCMDDEQALNGDENPSVGEVLDNALEASGTCTPLLNDMLEELTGRSVDSLSEQEKRKILEESL